MIMSKVVLSMHETEFEEVMIFVLSGGQMARQDFASDLHCSEIQSRVNGKRTLIDSRQETKRCLMEPGECCMHPIAYVLPVLQYQTSAPSLRAMLCNVRSTRCGCISNSYSELFGLSA